jgi:glycosyltransferase involved in cell wall biosynthesis
MLESGWVRQHAHEFDVMHVHFGFDALRPEELRSLVAALRAEGKPLVVTVHDLRNPHHRERGLHDDQLSVLVQSADALITLTPGAASEIERRWGRRADVLPHPHVVEEPTLSRPRPDHGGFVVGVHAKSLRANMDPLLVVEAVAELLSEMPGARIRVDAHTDVMTPGFPNHEPALATRLRGLERQGRIELHVHDYFSDADLWDYLQSLDVSVLPYRFGTHSGWLEACFDLGTVVVAPDCGYYAQQRPCLTYSAAGTRTARAASLQGAVRTAYRDRPCWRAEPAARRAERQMLARAHRDIYAEVLTRSAACTS